MIRIRPAADTDLSFLRAVLYHAIYVPEGEVLPPSSILDQPEIAQYVQGFGSQQGDIGCVAMDGDQPIGAAWLRLMHGYGYVDDATPELTIALLPDYRGRGIGGQLLNALFEAARPYFAQISLSVTWENPARRLYERLDFQTVKLEHGTATMTKHLAISE